MARTKKQAELREADRVNSEQISVTLAKGQKDRLDKAAKAAKTTRSGAVQQALDSWIFHPRQRPKNVKTARARRPRPV